MTKHNQTHFLRALWLAVLLPACVPAALAKQPTVSVNWVKHYYGCDSLTVRDKEITLVKGTNMFCFAGNSRRIEFNGVAVWLSAPVTKQWGRWRILKRDVNKTIVPLLYQNRSLIQEGHRLVVLDAGHGGNDKGVTDPSGNIEESCATLYLARKTRDILQAKRITVRLTRTSGRWLSLDERCELAKRYGADVFVSIHLNSSTSSSASGVETHIVPPAGFPTTANPSTLATRDRITYPANSHDEANIILGLALQKSLVRHRRCDDRGVRRSRFYVVRNVSCPSALVECGFISNQVEAKRFMDKAYQDKIAQAIAEGILSYLDAVTRARR